MQYFLFFSESINICFNAPCSRMDWDTDINSLHFLVCNLPISIIICDNVIDIFAVLSHIQRIWSWKFRFFSTFVVYLRCTYIKKIFFILSSRTILRDDICFGRSNYFRYLKWGLQILFGLWNECSWKDRIYLIFVSKI